MRTVVLSMRRADAAEYAEARDAISHDWVMFLEENGFLPQLVSNAASEPEVYLDGTDVVGLVLSNGEDIPVFSEGGKADFSGPREQTEKRLLEYAVRKRIPVLGVCRGMQFINLYFGGSVKDVSAVSRVPGDHAATCHSLNIIDEYCCCEFSVFTVNSYHNKCVTLESLSPSLKAFATDEEGQIVEGFYHPALSIAGIQWHPERPGASGEIDRALLDKLFVHRECGVTAR